MAGTVKSLNPYLTIVMCAWFNADSCIHTTVLHWICTYRMIIYIIKCYIAINTNLNPSFKYLNWVSSTRVFWNKVCVSFCKSTLLYVTQPGLSINKVYLRYHYRSHNARSLQTLFHRYLLQLGLLRNDWDQSDMNGLSTEFFAFFSPSKPARTTELTLYFEE